MLLRPTAGVHRKREERLDAAEEEAKGPKEPEMPRPNQMEREFPDLMHRAWERLAKAQRARRHSRGW